MKIIIDENKENILFNYIINESVYYGDKINIIKKYLDSNFIKSSYNSFDENGDISGKPIVKLLDNNGMPTDISLTLEQLYYKLQYKFKNIISDKKGRNQLLWQTVNDWYFNKISKFGTLSSY